MKKSITYIILLTILIVVNIFALKGLGEPAVAAHRAEFLADFFRGSILDWIGLVLFNLNLIAFGLGVTLEPDFYEEVGSSSKGIVFFFVAPIIWLALIFIG